MTKKERFAQAMDYLNSHLTAETAAETLRACQLSATQLQQGQHIQTASDHDDLVLLELEKTVALIQQSLRTVR